jgi:hypothetical protein
MSMSPEGAPGRGSTVMTGGEGMGGGGSSLVGQDEPDDESSPIIAGVGSPARRRVGFKGLGSSDPAGVRGRREGPAKAPRTLYAGSKAAVKKKRMIDADTEFVQRLTMGSDEPPSPWIENVGKQVRGGVGRGGASWFGGEPLFAVACGRYLIGVLYLTH